MTDGMRIQYGTRITLLMEVLIEAAQTPVMHSCVKVFVHFL